MRMASLQKIRTALEKPALEAIELSGLSRYCSTTWHSLTDTYLSAYIVSEKPALEAVVGLATRCPPNAPVSAGMFRGEII